MLKNLLDKIFKKPKARQNSDLDFEITEQEGGSSYVKLNMEKWSEEDKNEIQSKAAEILNIKRHSGYVEHGYTLKYVATSAQCPRCKAETKKCYANFIYATNVATRIMFAPAGYFCQKCPTVIIDEEMIKSGIVGNFIFQGVLGIEDDPKQDPSLFSTWNGDIAVYIIDENGMPQGIAPMKPHRMPIARKKNKNREKNRLAKLSRRRNQKRK